MIRCSVAFLAGEVAYHLEHVVILIFEAVHRIIVRFDPRLYVERLRVEKVVDGWNNKPGGKFVVLVVFPESGTLPGFTTTFVEAVARSQFNLVVVSNAPLSHETLGHLLAQSHLVIERSNIGRDFGGYKDAMAILRRRAGEMSRLVLANDSVFYFDDALEDLLSRLDGGADFIGVSEVYDHHYHVASFLLSFGPRILNSAAFSKFWRFYLPVGSRRWAIFKGEGRLTRVLLRAGFRPHILFRADDLRNCLRQVNERHRAEIVSLLSRSARGLISQRDISSDPDKFADAVIAAIMKRNQMHAAGFLFRKFLRLPAVKRDIYFRGIHSLSEIEVLLREESPAVAAEITRDLSRRGRIEDKGWYARFLFRHSAA